MDCCDNSEHSRRTVIKTIGGTGALLALAGCMGDTDDNGDSQYIAALGDEPTTLDMHNASRQPEVEVLQMVHEPLFLFNPDQEPVPHLVDEYEAEPEEGEYTFWLKEGIEFHNGEELTSDVAKWSLERFTDENLYGYYLAPTNEIETDGDYGLRFHFDGPFPRIFQILTEPTTGIVSKQAFEEAGDDYGRQTIVGTGPYEFVEWDRGDSITLERNEEYDHGPDWLTNTGPANIDEFYYRIIPEDSTLVQELMTGEVNGSTYVSYSQVEEVANHDNSEIVEETYTYKALLSINTQKEPTDDLDVRKAINYAIDKDAVVNVAINGQGGPLWSMTPPNARFGMSESEAREKGIEYDPDSARSKLEEAGWTNDVEGEVRSKDGEDLSLEFFSFTIEQYALMAETIEPMLRDVGFDVNLEVLESGNLYDRLEGAEHNITTMAGGGNDAIDAMENLLHGDNDAREGGGNFSIWLNDEFDSRIDEAKVEPDVDRQEELLIEAQEIVLEEFPVAPLLTENELYGHETQVQGIDEWTSHPWWPEIYLSRALELDI
ncbi:ABC transporter substrate-binding protein [Natrialbaceae archaeon A-CW2]